MVNNDLIQPAVLPQQPLEAAYPKAPQYVQGPGYKALSKEAVEDTKALLAKVKMVAETNTKVVEEQVQARQNARAARPPVDRFIFIDNGIRLFNREEVHHHHHHGQGKAAPVDKEEQEKTQRKWIAVAGTLVAAASSYLLGAAWAAFEDLQEEYNEIQGLVSKWEINKFDHHFASGSKIEEVQKRAVAILTRKFDNHVYKIAYYATLLFASLVLVGAALAAVKTVMAVSFYFMLFSSVAYLGRIGYQQYSKMDEKDKAVINKLLPQISVV